MPRYLISNAYKQINEIPTVPIYYLANPQPRERAWNNQRGKKTLLSFTLVWLCEVTFGVQPKWEIYRTCKTTTCFAILLIPLSRIRFYGSRLKAHYCTDLGGRHSQVGSSAGAAHLLNDNTGDPRSAQREQKSRLESKGKS